MTAADDFASHVGAAMVWYRHIGEGAGYGVHLGHVSTTTDAALTVDMTDDSGDARRFRISVEEINGEHQ